MRIINVTEYNSTGPHGRPPDQRRCPIRELAEFRAGAGAGPFLARARVLLAGMVFHYGFGDRDRMRDNGFPIMGRLRHLEYAVRVSGTDKWVMMFQSTIDGKWHMTMRDAFRYQYLNDMTVPDSARRNIQITDYWLESYDAMGRSPCRIVRDRWNGV